MKKLLSYLFLLVAVMVLASCEAVVSVSSLQVSGQKEEFVLGEEFSTGEMTVIAVYTNGNEEDVTSKVKVTPSTDMSAAGNFTVEVYFEGCTAEYNIRIEQPQLVSLEVKHELANKSYLVGQELSTEGVEVVAHYTNSITGETQETVENYELVVKNAAGEVVKGAFEAVGTYTVAISFGGKTESYEVEVSNNFASVEAAIAAGVANAGKVASGTFSKKYSWAETANVTEYAFGNNYFTHADEYGTYHYSLDAEGNVICASESWGEVQSYDAEPQAMNGVTDSVLYNSYTFWGADELVKVLYDAAVEAGVEIAESVNEGVYSFSYNYTIVEDYGGEDISYYYYNAAVSFKLGNVAEFSEVSYVQSQYYAENVVVAEDGSWSVAEGAVADDVTTYSFAQTAGERTAENPYAPEKVKYQSFDLVDAEGNAAAAEYETLVGTPVTVYVGNALPETANPAFNTFVFTTDEEVDMYGYASGNALNIYVYSAGTHTITITCGEIVKQVTIVTTQPQPESVAAYASEYMDFGWMAGYEMVETSTVTVEAGAKLYVGGLVSPSRADQSITIALKEEYTDASLSEIQPDDWDVPYFDGKMLNFNSSTIGTYVVVITSVVNPELSCELTITVVEATIVVPTPSVEGMWTAVNPMTGVTICTIDVYDGYAYFSDGMSNIMMGVTVEDSSVTFMVGVAYQGTLSIENVVLNEDFTVMTALVTYMGTAMELTFTK